MKILIYAIVLLVLIVAGFGVALALLLGWVEPMRKAGK